jgi:hypothetical protein
MRKLGIIAVLSLLALALAAVPALAAAPNFKSATSSVANNGALVVSFDERGLGNENIDYTLTGDGTATFACINRGGKNPEAANKQTIAFPVVEKASFEVKNGRVVESITSDAPSAGSFSCPGGQRLVLADVSYTNLELTDTTNNVSTSVADASRTFFTV